MLNDCLYTSSECTFTLKMNLAFLIIKVFPTSLYSIIWLTSLFGVDHFTQAKLVLIMSLIFI